jgi:hypothetical protein
MLCDSVRTMRLWKLTSALICTTLLMSGCSDGIDLNGKVFDWVGVSPAAQAVKKTEPKLAERAPLVLPPVGYVLPPPGSGQQPLVALVNDPDQRKEKEAKERERLHMAYCSGELTWKDAALAGGRGHAAGGRGAADPVSPYGPCPGILNATSFANGLKKEKE